jgi:hypothetical protein
MASTPKRARSKRQRYRERLRASGLRPVQIWVPDTRAPGFAAEVRAQSLRLSRHRSDREALDFIEAAFVDDGRKPA